MTARRRDAQKAIRKLNLIGFASIALGMGGVGAWAATTHISGAVIAPGAFIVESNVKKVQHLAGGIVGEILVQEGDPVRAGQVVLRLDDTLTRANLGVIQAQLDQFQAREARLTAERDGAQDVDFDPGLQARGTGSGVEVSLAGERKLFNSRRRAREGQRSQLQERIRQIRNETEGQTAQQSAKKSEIQLIARELEGVDRLYQQNLVTTNRLTQLQREKTRLEGEYGMLTADIARARGKIAETELQLLQLDQDFLTEVLKDQREAQARIAELRERFNAAEDELHRVDIRAPQDGIVHQLAAHTVGGVIGRGETVMQIVPSRARLVVEARIAPTDIDQVTLGAPVAVRLMAGNRRTAPDLDGTVSQIAPDLTREQTYPSPDAAVRSYYAVRIALPPGDLPSGDDVQIVPGMQVEVFLRTQDRTPLDYLLKPLKEQVSRTFRER